MSQDDIRSLRRVYAAMQSGDAEDFRRDLAHDIEWSLPEGLPWGGTRHGADGVETLLEIFGDHVDGSWADPDDFLDAGDRIVVLGRLRGRARSSGRAYEVRFAHVWGMTDGVPSWFVGYFDSNPIMAALGARS